MSRSTATFVAYDLRPAKQTERRMLLAFLECAKEVGLMDSDYRYVGMGGYKFYDFILMHRYVGLKNMISIEHDSDIIDRCEFNRPYNFIEIKGTDTYRFLNSDNYDDRTVYWFDYDSSLSDSIIDDIQLLGSNIKLGSFAFFTVAADVPGDLKELRDVERLEELQEQFGDLALELHLEDVENSNFSRTVYKILNSAITNAFSARADGCFFPEFRILYKDTTKMLTVGGYFCTIEESEKLRKKLNKSLPFLVKNDSEPFRIRHFNLSERERHLIEFASTAGRRCKEANQLRRLGIKDSDIEAYRDLVRFMPRYFETIS